MLIVGMVHGIGCTTLCKNLAGMASIFSRKTMENPLPDPSQIGLAAAFALPEKQEFSTSNPVYVVFSARVVSTP